MATLDPVTLNEEILFEDLETKEISKFLPEDFFFIDIVSQSFEKIFFEDLDLAEEVFPVKAIYLTEDLILAEEIFPGPFLKERLSLEDQSFKYKSQRHQTFEIKIYRNGIWQEDIEKGDILRFNLKRVLTEEVSEGYVEFQNADQLDIQEGDQIELLWQSEGSTLPVRIFLGEIDKVEKEWDEEENEQTVKVLFQGWGKLLLERKTTSSFAEATNVNTIINQLLEDIQKSEPVYIHDRKISLSGVDTYTQTRTVDFVGESLWDCLKKLAFITRSEFFIDKDKRLRFFERSSSQLNRTLLMDDFSDYRYEQRDDLVCNTCQVYGHQNKPYPYDCDSPWSEGTTNWSCTMEPASTISSTTIPPPYLGDYSIKLGVAGTIGPEEWRSKFWGYSFSQSWPGQGMRIVFDLTPPEGKAIEFSQMYVCHSGASKCKLWYSWVPLDPYPDTGWTQIGEIEDTCDWTTFTEREGSINQKLYLRWSTGPPPYSKTTTISGFGVWFRYKPLTEKEELFNATYTLPVPVDIKAEQGYRKLQFHMYSSLQNYATGTTLAPNVFTVSLHFEGGHAASYQAQFQGLFLSGWSSFDIPIGPEEEGWTAVPQGTLTAIDFMFTMVTNNWTGTDHICLDGLHLDEGKWYGDYKDENSMKDRSQGGYGIKYRKIFDDTLYSDTAAQRWAKETVERYKEPLIYLRNVEATIDGIEFLDLGDLVRIYIPETPGDTEGWGKEYEYRILEIEYLYDEEEDFYTKLLLERTSTYKEIEL